MKAQIRNNILRLFWITLTVGIFIFTVYNSVRTIGNIRRTNEQSETLDVEIEKYKSKIEADSTFTENMKSSQAFRESYARENLHMRREGETVYLY
jgi:cell division protein FtsB